MSDGNSRKKDRTPNTPPESGPDPGPDTPPNPGADWLTISLAAAETGLSSSKIRWLGDSQQVRRRSTSSGSFEYFMPDLYKLTPDRGNDLQAIQAQVLGTLLEHMLTVSRFHNDWIERIFRTSSEETIQVRKRNTELESGWLKAIELGEDLMSREHERMLSAKKSEQNAALRREAFESLKVYGPVLIEHWMTNQAQAKAASALRGAIPQEKIQAALDALGLSDEQAEQFATLFRAPPSVFDVEPPQPEPTEPTNEKPVEDS